MGKIIAVAVPKGGVGKTTNAVNPAIAFALSGKRTLLIDVDPAGACAEILDFKKEEIKSDIFDVLQFTSSLQQVTLKSTVTNQDFIPMKHITYVDEIRLGKIAKNEKLLGNILKSEAFSYNYVLISTMPGQLSINAVNRIVDHI